MNAVQVSPKQQILDLVRPMFISEGQFSTFNETIAKKLAERVLLAREVENQPELDRIYGLYRIAVEGHKTNLQTQYDLGQKTFRQIVETEDLSKIGEILQAFQIAIAPVLEVHKKHEAEITDYEGKIVALLPVGVQFLI